MLDQGVCQYSDVNQPFRGLTSIYLQPDSPYKNGIFHFELQLPENFPFKAPTVRPFLILSPL